MSIQPHSPPKTPELDQKIAKFAIFCGGGKPIFRVKPCRKIHAGRYRFVVRARVGGRWTRRYFPARKPAETYAQLRNTEVENQGRESAEFPTWLRVMADQCHQLLSPHGQTIQDATIHLLRVLEATRKSRTISEVVEELLRAKQADGASPRYMSDLKYRLQRFASDFDGEMVATITEAQIDDWLRGLPVSPVTRNNFRRVLIVGFNYARGRGYCLANPAGATAKAKVVESEVQILSIKETTRLLTAATAETLPYFAIGCFAGLRPAEISRLEWSDIDIGAGLIEVTARKSKTAARRFIRVRENLAAWLWPYRRHSGAVVPINARKKFEAVRRSAKIGVWKTNSMRHSFASYHLAHFKDAAALALEMGHTDSGMIFEHYRQLVKPAEAERFWQVAPA